MFGNCSGHWVRTLNASFWVLIVKKKKERKKERDIKYNEIPIFNGEKGEVGNRDLTKVTSGELSDNF